MWGVVALTQQPIIGVPFPGSLFVPGEEERGGCFHGLELGAVVLVATLTGEVISLSWIEGEWIVPLLAALLGASVGGLVSWFVRRQELYVAAAVEIELLMRDARDALESITPGTFSHDEIEAAENALRLIGSARWQSNRLQSGKLTNRFAVTEWATRDAVGAQDAHAVYWAKEALEDAMRGLLPFLTLPPLSRLFRKGRSLPPNSFPDTPELYRSLTAPIEGSETLSYRKLRNWQKEQSA